MGIRRFLSALILFSILVSCQKENDDPPPSPGSLRLTEVRSGNSASADVNVTTLEYDLENRLTAIYIKEGSSARRILYQISYNGSSTVTVRDEASLPAYSRLIVFTLDGTGRPAMKFERSLLSIDLPSPFQRTVTEHTNTYSYGPDGFLERTITRIFDSTYAPSTASGIQRQSSTDTTYHTNSGGNLAYTLSQGRDTIVRYGPGPLSTITREKRSREDFDYSMQLSLGNYGKNAFLYQEMNYLGITRQPNYLPYLNMANKSFKRSEIQDASGAWIFASSDLVEIPQTAIFTFNALKLVEGIQIKDSGSGLTYFVKYTYL